jgi:hypothetical protein
MGFVDRRAASIRSGISDYQKSWRCRPQSASYFLNSELGKAVRMRETSPLLNACPVRTTQEVGLLVRAQRRSQNLRIDDAQYLEDEQAVRKASKCKKGGWTALFLVPKVELTAFFATLAGVLFVVGGHATLQAALLAAGGGEAHACWGRGAGGCFTVSFGTELFGHAITPVN